MTSNTPDPLDGVTVVGGRIQFSAGPGAPTDDITAGGVSGDRLQELYDAGDFPKHVRRVLALGSKVSGYKSVAVPEGDQAFADACEVVYRRLSDGPGRFVLEWIANDLIVDLFVVGGFVGPYLKGIRQERRTKTEARRVAATADKPASMPDQETVEVETPDDEQS